MGLRLVDGVWLALEKCLLSVACGWGVWTLGLMGWGIASCRGRLCAHGAGKLERFVAAQIQKTNR